MGILSKIFKDPNQKVIERMQPIVDQINNFETDIMKLSDSDLLNKTNEFKNRLDKGETLDDLLPEAFAVVREANKRCIGIRHYDVQLIGGIVLHRGEIAEMKTGEGKTHVAALAAYLNALPAKGVHVITVNDYLARRDAAWNGPANHMLGLSTACIIHNQGFLYDPDFVNEEQSEERMKRLKPCSRKEAYNADVTYGTNSEFGFDYLRDNMAPNIEAESQRGHAYAIVDEVDSVLIDEARTPLIISAPAEESASLYKKFAGIVPKLIENTDYNIDEKMKAVTLTDEGIERVEKILGMGNIYNEGGITMVHHLEQALRAQTLFKKDKDYVVNNGEVLIIDEFTGRIMAGRRYSEGLHQAIEAKENVEVNKESRTLATITLQNYFRMYDKLAGMTGTAITEAEEFSKIYKLEVTQIPTNKPVTRKDLSDRIYSTEIGKLKAVADEIKKINATGQPVLVGTISIEKNELLSQLLNSVGVKHELLNAKQHEREAQILSQAGQVGAVTVATNMAGRGVDIILGGVPFDEENYNKVKEIGGLFVLGTERHESRRIDNQLRGRAGRQGDPGASQFYVSMEDDLMRIFGSDRVKSIMQRLGIAEDQAIENKMISNSIEKAQIKVEGNNFDIRKHLVEYDDVINKQREIIYKRRRQILISAEEDGHFVKEEILNLIDEEINQLVSFHTVDPDQTKWNLKEIAETVKTIFPTDSNLLEQLEDLEKIAGDKSQDAVARTQIIDLVVDKARQKFIEFEEDVNKQAGNEKYFSDICREVLIRSIDNLWVDHLDAMTALRTGIGLRGYGQRDPLIEYQRESKQMFLQLLSFIQRQVVYNIFKIGFGTQMKQSIMQDNKATQSGGNLSGQFLAGQANPYEKVAKVKVEEVVVSKVKNDVGEKVGRNDPCPCGSGKKYKNCCG